MKKVLRRQGLQLAILKKELMEDPVEEEARRRTAFLDLSEAAAPEEIETAYRHLVRRFPPEFQPEKLREIDEAYRPILFLKKTILAHFRGQTYHQFTLIQSLVVAQPLFSRLDSGKN